MNPSSKNWLKEYLSYYEKQKLKKSQHIVSENDIYKLLFDSSLLFAIPLKSSDNLHPDFNKWNLKEKTKILFTNHLFQISDLYISKYDNTLKLSDVSNRLMLSEKTELETEAYIDQLINGKKNSWLLNTYNLNPWMFLSLIQFYYFIKGKALDTYQIKLDVLKGMIMASKADNIITNNEKKLLKRYIENGNFSKEDKLILSQYLDNKIVDIKYLENNYLIKKTRYDLALFALMTNNKIDNKELIFINTYADKLNISLPEQHRTFSLIQNIYLNHYQELPHLQKTYSFASVKNIVKHNFKYILKKNSGMIINEIRESKELIVLLRKSTDEKLSDEEKQKIREQILDLLKTIPSLAIFMIPGGTIILPLLMKILPENLLYPSSFVNKNLDN